MKNNAITTMFCFAYDFIKELDENSPSTRVCGARSRNPKSRMQVSEVATILDLFRNYPNA